MTQTPLLEKRKKLEQRKNRLKQLDAVLKLQERKQRTRRLIALGGLVSKASLDTWNANALLGGLLFLKEKEGDTSQVDAWALRERYALLQRRMWRNKMKRSVKKKISLKLASIKDSNESFQSNYLNNKSKTASKNCFQFTLNLIIFYVVNQNRLALWKNPSSLMEGKPRVEESKAAHQTRSLFRSFFLQASQIRQKDSSSLPTSFLTTNDVKIGIEMFELHFRWLLKYLSNLLTLWIFPRPRKKTFKTALRPLDGTRGQGYAQGGNVSLPRSSPRTSLKRWSSWGACRSSFHN